MKKITDDDLLALIARWTEKRKGRIPTARELRDALAAKEMSCSTNRLLLGLARARMDGRRSTTAAAKDAAAAIIADRESAKERAARRREASVIADPRDVAVLQAMADRLATWRLGGQENPSHEDALRSALQEATGDLLAPAVPNFWNGKK
jgi:hypothetical protein